MFEDVRILSSCCGDASAVAKVQGGRPRVVGPLGATILKDERGPSFLAAAMLLVSLCGGRLSAQQDVRGPKLQFNPSLAVGYSTTDNVNYLDDPTASTSSDTSTQLTANLPVERRFRTGTWDLQYLGSWTRYSDNGTLDNAAHYLETGFNFEATRRSTFRVNGVYALTQQQAVPREAPDFVTGDELFLGERQEVRAYGVGLGYGLEIDPTWTWDTNISGSQAQASPIDGYQDGTSGLARQDTNSFQARTRFDRERSERFTLGGEYQYSRFDLTDEGVEVVHALSTTWNRKLGRKSTLAGELGGYHRSSDAGATTTSYQADGVLVAVSYSYTPVTGLTARLGLSVAPTSGGTLQGTSTNRTIQAFLTGNHENSRLVWELGGYHSVRDASDGTVPTLEVLSLTASVEHVIQAAVGLRLQGNRADQVSDVDGYAEGQYYSATLNCVWYPLGRTLVSGG